MKGIKISQSITDRQDTSLGLYFKDVSKLPLLSTEEEKIVAKKAKEGDKKAIDKLILSNLRFAISVAKQYQGKGMPLVDLVQAANLGLIESIKHYDPDKGYKFISFAVWWVRQSITKALTNNCRTVRVPMSQVLYYNKVNKATERFEQKHGRKPSVDELEKETELSSDKINSSMKVSNRSISLDSPFKEEDASSLIDVIPNKNAEATDDYTHDNDRAKIIEAIISTLPNRESDILRMSFGINMPALLNDEIAKRFGIGTERVRQIQRDALLYLKKNYSKGLKELL